MRTTDDLHRNILDSLSVHVAVLDGGGVILETNRAWQEFGRANGLTGSLDCVGVDYLAVCDRDPEARTIGSGLRRVLAGSLPEFLTRYPCHGPDGERWYALRAVPFRYPGPARLVMSHENITPIVQAQEALARTEKELRAQKQKLEESNIALKVLLENGDRERQQLEETVVTNVRSRLLPLVENLRAGKRPAREEALLASLDRQLRELVDPFLDRLTTVHRFLSPREIEIAAFIREGRTSKEIAAILGISTSAVDFHRKKLRRKLGLTETGASLRAHLLALR